MTFPAAPDPPDPQPLGLWALRSGLVPVRRKPGFGRQVLGRKKAKQNLLVLKGVGKNKNNSPERFERESISLLENRWFLSGRKSKWKNSSKGRRLFQVLGFKYVDGWAASLRSALDMWTGRKPLCETPQPLTPPSAAVAAARLLVLGLFLLHLDLAASSCWSSMRMPT